MENNKQYENHELVIKAMNFALRSHEETNHFYDDYLPYSFHLRMAIKVAYDFLYLLPNHMDKIWAIGGTWCHDTIEDARQNYNSVKKYTCIEIAEIARACTNLTRGRNRKERMPDWIYEDIAATHLATFVKLCDRIANVQYGKLTGSSMVETYRNEQEHFKTMLHVKDELEPMWKYLDELFVIIK